MDRAKLIEKLQQLRKQAVDAMNDVDEVTMSACGHTVEPEPGCAVCDIFCMADQIGASLAQMGNAIDKLAEE